MPNHKISQIGYASPELNKGLGADLSCGAAFRDKGCALCLRLSKKLNHLVILIIMLLFQTKAIAVPNENSVRVDPNSHDGGTYVLENSKKVNLTAACNFKSTFNFDKAKPYSVTSSNGLPELYIEHHQSMMFDHSNPSQLMIKLLKGNDASSVGEPWYYDHDPNRSIKKFTNDKTVLQADDGPMKIVFSVNNAKEAEQAQNGAVNDGWCTVTIEQADVPETDNKQVGSDRFIGKGLSVAVLFVLLLFIGNVYQKTTSSLSEPMRNLIVVFALLVALAMICTLCLPDGYFDKITNIMQPFLNSTQAGQTRP